MLLHSTKHKGFTLIELLVSVTIFVFFIALGVASYLNLSVALKKENIERRLYTEIENVLGDINRWGKFYQIDYASYAATNSIDPVNGNGELVLLSKDRLSRIHLKQIPNATDSTKFSLGLYREKWDEAQHLFVPDDNFTTDTFAALTSSEINVNQLKFFLYPATEDQANTYQQKITIVINGHMLNPYTAQNQIFNMQTSFSSRLYTPSL